ncbi:PIG-L family deacetylase [Cytophagaceae bacterium ABcell3]|nr:PIG-L family deacetylase [Cytophagaceae bacterium ABcell3]
MQTILIFSPHLDDAILSCGSSINHWVTEGNEVIVISIFTSCGRHSQAELYEKRKKDDIKALQFLGCKFAHLDFVDAPFRDAQNNSFSSILFHHDLKCGKVAGLLDSVLSCIEIYKPSQIYFPLGVGGHIDHHQLFLSSLDCSHFGEAICYYEDLPYALVPCWSNVRLQNLGYLFSEKDKEMISSQMIPEQLSDCEIAFVKNYMGDKNDQGLSNEKYKQEIRNLRCERKTENNLPWVNLVPFQIGHTEEQFNTKMEAISFYETEWPVLFGENMASIREVLYNSSDAFVERFWKIR